LSKFAILNLGIHLKWVC